MFIECPIDGCTETPAGLRSWTTATVIMHLVRDHGYGSIEARKEIGVRSQLLLITGDDDMDGAEIREARKAAGMSAQDLAHECGVSDATIYGWETNKWNPTPDKLATLREVLFNGHGAPSECEDPEEPEEQAEKEEGEDTGCTIKECSTDPEKQRGDVESEAAVIDDRTDEEDPEDEEDQSNGEHNYDPDDVVLYEKWNGCVVSYLEVVDALEEKAAAEFLDGNDIQAVGARLALNSVRSLLREASERRDKHLQKIFGEDTSEE